MRALGLLFGWGVLCAVVFVDGMVLELGWTFIGGAGPSPERTGLPQLWICIAAMAALVWMVRRMADPGSLIGSFLLTLATIALGILATMGARGAPWIRWTVVVITCAPMVAWVLGVVLRYWSERSSRRNLAGDPLPSNKARDRFFQVAGIAMLAAIVVALGFGQWWWVTRVCMTTPPALWQAVRHQDPAAVRWALEHGVDPETKDTWSLMGPGRNMSVLMMAAEKGDVETVRLLLDAGAQVNWQNEYGGTAIHLAAMHGHAAVVQALLDAKANPNLEARGTMEFDDVKGVGTALHAAAACGCCDAVELLLKRGADKRKCNRNGKSAAEIAAERIQEKERSFREPFGKDPSSDKEFQKTLEPYRTILRLLSEPVPKRTLSDTGS